MPRVEWHYLRAIQPRVEWREDKEDFGVIYCPGGLQGFNPGEPPTRATRSERAPGQIYKKQTRSSYL